MLTFQWDDPESHTHLLVNRHGKRMLGAICHYSDGWVWVQCGPQTTDAEREEIQGHMARLNAGANYA